MGQTVLNPSSAAGCRRQSACATAMLTIEDGEPRAKIIALE